MNLLFGSFSSSVLFDMEMYRTDSADSTIPVTLRISNTRLFVSAQSENEPVLLKVSCSKPPTYSHLHLTHL